MLFDFSARRRGRPIVIRRGLANKNSRAMVAGRMFFYRLPSARIPRSSEICRLLFPNLCLQSLAWAVLYRVKISGFAPLSFAFWEIRIF